MLLNLVLEVTIESPLDSKKIKPVNLKGNQPWIFIGRTDAEAKAPILWPPDVKSWLIGKDPDAVKDWRQEEKGMTKNEMVRWHHKLDGHEFEQTPGDSEGQGSLACYSQSMGLQRVGRNLVIEQHFLEGTCHTDFYLWSNQISPDRVWELETKIREWVEIKILSCSPTSEPIVLQ